VANLSSGRFWAREKGREPLASPPNALMRGGTKSLAELIASTERAVLVTNFWYMRSVDPRTLLYTGLTRDGVFWVEDGEIVRPLHDFRWNDSPIRAFKNALELSTPGRVGGRGGRSRNVLVPAMRVSAFGFSSVSEAV
jgi:predicted Zn-dependent protease